MLDFSLLVYNAMPCRSTLSDANLRRNESIFEAIYGELYATYKRVLSADSRRCGCPKWIERLQIIDSTTISLFSNLIFKDVGGIRRPGKRRAASKFTPILCQRVCALRHSFHLGAQEEFLHAPPLQLPQRRSTNAIKIQIWVTLIANLLLMVLQKRIKRNWSFSNLATVVRIMLMYYINCDSFFVHRKKIG